MSGYSELLVKGEGRKEGRKTLFKHGNLIKFTSVYKNRNSVLPKSRGSWGSAKEKIFAEVGIPRNNGLRLIVVSNAGMSLPACSRL